MSSKYLGIAAIVLLFDTVLFLVVGVSMWNDAPSPAVEAVGKGLVTLGVASSLPTVVAYCLLLAAMPRRTPNPARSDWDSV